MSIEGVHHSFFFFFKVVEIMSFLRVGGGKELPAKLQAAEKLLLGKKKKNTKNLFHANHLLASCLLPRVPVCAY